MWFNSNAPAAASLAAPATEPFTIKQRIPLRFDLPLPLARRKPHGLGLALGQAFDPFQQALADLRLLNHTRLPTDKRFHDTERFAQALWPHVSTQLRELSQARRFNRIATRNRLELFERLLCTLIGAYQLVFAADYEENRSPGARTAIAALRILEWSRALQRLNALRYRPLSANAWQTVNTTFFALAALAATAEHLPALDALPLPSDAAGLVDAQKIYLAIQSFALFDGYSWPRAQQGFIDTYCAHIVAGMRLVAKIEDGPEQRFVHAYQDSPPALAPPTDDTPCATLDFRILAAAIRADRRALPRARMRLQRIVAERRGRRVRLPVRRP